MILHVMYHKPEIVSTLSMILHLQISTVLILNVEKYSGKWKDLSLF